MKMSVRRWNAEESSMRNTQVTHPLYRSRFWLAAAALIAIALPSHVSGAQNTGINFPPNQGTSGGGAFLPGIYTYTYTNAQIAAANST